MMADKLTLELRALSKGVGIVDGGGGVACLFDPLTCISVGD